MIEVVCAPHWDVRSLGFSASDSSVVFIRDTYQIPSLEVLRSLAHLTICIFDTGNSDSSDLWIHV